MGAYTSRNRAWVYVAFYDEYVGRHINTCAGLSLLFTIPLYLLEKTTSISGLIDFDEIQLMKTYPEI
ncbi:hypothetical protein FGO68_gene11221 [Halteria grandinella]|uniref:Uncharacterized protein n=1 Tax=Halteria grandinella TaxID=5974 RepID=A0A8J8NP95_HALGN|nr:hypothetical protein FGO68_gene11221 [Halteria grandinella]